MMNPPAETLTIHKRVDAWLTSANQSDCSSIEHKIFTRLADDAQANPDTMIALLLQVPSGMKQFTLWELICDETWQNKGNLVLTLELLLRRIVVPPN